MRRALKRKRIYFFFFSFFSLNVSLISRKTTGVKIKAIMVSSFKNYLPTKIEWGWTHSESPAKCPSSQNIISRCNRIMSSAKVRHLALHSGARQGVCCFWRFKKPTKTSESSSACLQLSPGLEHRHWSTHSPQRWFLYLHFIKCPCLPTTQCCQFGPNKA